MRGAQSTDPAHSLSTVSPLRFYGEDHYPFQRSQIIRQRRDTETGDPGSLYETFPAQKEAFEFVDRRSASLRRVGCTTPLLILSYEIDSSGSRRYVATTIESFLRRYWQFENKHFYEVIQESRACKLFFDLEFALRSAGGGVLVDEKFALEYERGRRMVATLVFGVCAALKRFADESHMSIDAAVLDPLELDSTTREKFSCHLIFPHVIFHDNVAMGHFIRCRILPTLTPDIAVGLVDLSVYTRNRSFRLPYSSKRGRKAALKPTDRWYGRELLTLEMDAQKKQVMREAMLTYTRYDTNNLSVFHNGEAPSRLHSISTPSMSGGSEASDTLISSTGGISRFPCLDAFVIQHAVRVGGLPAPRIRAWMWYPASKTVVYSMVDHRYCDRIQRWHKSNNILYVADLENGMLYQKCHDLECAHWRSDGVPIPLEAMERGCEQEISDDSVSDTQLHALMDSFEQAVCLSASNTVSSDDLSDQQLLQLEELFELERNMNGMTNSLRSDGGAMLD